MLEPGQLTQARGEVAHHDGIVAPTHDRTPM